jgi:hypothetical protein
MVFQPGVHSQPASRREQAALDRRPGTVRDAYRPLARTVLCLRQRVGFTHRGRAAWPMLRPCPGLRSLGAEFSGAAVQGGLRTTAPRHPLSILPCFSHLKPSGVSRGLPFAAGKNSAPRARRPQPRRNAGQSAGAGSKSPVFGEGRVRLRPTRPKRLRQLAVVKRQPPRHSREVMVETEAVMEKIYRVVVERAGM